ncbi:MAG: VWA domain-containing protein [Verrucomicrobia bacterium]|nr:VWA domain-containing protein [Verrucomicrobiota bacterium]
MIAPLQIAIAFINPLLLTLLALGSIPIIIHLLYRRRFRTVWWGAMEFLLLSDKETAKRLRILQILLLITRVAIVLFIVGALARPLLTGAFFGGVLGQNRSTAAVVLDNSYSMGQQQANTTLLERAKDAGEGIASTFRKGDSLTLLTVGPKPAPVSEAVGDPEVLRRQARAVPLSSGGTDMIAAISTALTEMKKTESTQRELFIITDCRQEGWRVEDTTGWQRINRLIEQFEQRPKIFIIDVSNPGTYENSFIESISLPSAPPSVNRGYSVECSIRTHSTEPLAPPSVTLYLDSDERAAGQTQGTPFEDGVSTAKFVFRPSEPGWHWGKVVIGPDSLDPDNVRYFVYEVRDNLDVLALSGSSSPETMSASWFAQLALAPDKNFETGDGDSRPSTSNIVSPTIASLSRMLEFDLGGYRAVFLTDTDQLPDHVADGLRSYVYSGGALVVMLDDAIDVESYARLADPERGEPLLPARAERFVGKAIDFAAEDDLPEGIHLGLLEYAHPVVAPFEDEKDGNLHAPAFYGYIKTTVDPDDPNVRVLIWFDNGDPFLIERRLGRGVVLMLTGGGDLRYSDLPLMPVYLPLMHRITYWLARRGTAAHELIPGEPIRYPVSARDSARELVLDRPSGAQERVRPVLAGIPGDEVGSRFPTIVYDKTDPAGIYRLTAEAADTASVLEPAFETRFCVNVDTRESDLTPVSPKMLLALFKATKAEYIRADEDVINKIKTSRRGREIWRFLAVAVCLLLMTESVLAHEIDRA